MTWVRRSPKSARVARGADRKSVVFYSSGRCSNEASYLYALFARLYGNNNLPDSSNMCHETTSVALPASIGVPVGTVTCGFRSDRLHPVLRPERRQQQPAHAARPAGRRRSDVPIIVYNPLRERGLERFINPQAPVRNADAHETRIASQYHQVMTGGDLAALTGHLQGADRTDDAARRPTRVLDHAFIAEHTHGFEDFAAWLRRGDWDEMERRSGPAPRRDGSNRRRLRERPAAIGIYGMGLTQHRAGVETVQMVVNLLLLRGNIGPPGAGICPVRGHSNVQGQRTVGHHRETRAGAARQARPAIRLQSAARARLQHSGGVRGYP